MRKIATGLLVLTWLFPLLAVVNRSLFALGNNPLLPPAVGLLNSNRTVLFFLALNAFLLLGLRMPDRSPLTLAGAAFLGWTVLSSILGLNMLNSLFFTLTWFSAALAMSACRKFSPLTLNIPQRIALLHAPLFLVSAAAIVPVAAGDAVSVSEPFQLGNVYSNWLLIFLPFVLRDFFEQRGAYFWPCLLSTSAALSSLALTFSRTAWILTLLQVSATILLLCEISFKRLVFWSAFLGSGLIGLVLFKAQLGGAFFILCIALLTLSAPIAETLFFKATPLALMRLAMSITLVTCCIWFVNQSNAELQGLASGRLERLAKGDNSALSRTEFWKAAIGIANDNPLLGTGPGNFALAYPQHQKRFYFYSDSPHSTSLELVSELGWAGGLLFLIFLTCYLWEVRKNWVNTPTQRMAALGVFFGLAHAQTDVTYQFASVWITLALMAATLIPQREAESKNRSRPALLAACFIVGSFLIWISATQKRYEFTSRMADEQEIFAECRLVSNRLTAWAEPAMKALQSGTFLAETAESQPEKDKILALLEPFYKRTTKGTKNNATAERIIGKYRRVQGQFKEAEVHLVRSLELDPFNHPVTYHQLLVLALEEKDNERVLKWAHEILERFPLEQLEVAHTGHRIGLSAQLVPVLFDAADSISPYNEPKKLEPIYRFLLEESKSPRAHYGLGICLWSQGKAEPGRQHLQKAHLLNPNYPPPPEVK